MSFADKIVLVTGASRGIGQAIADDFAFRGAKVIGTATTEQQAINITQRLSKFKGTGKFLQILEKNSIEDLISSIEKDFGNIDILVNNAGIIKDNLLMRMKDCEWDDVMNINLKAVYRSCKTVLRSMMKNKYGRIINITSVVGIMGNPGQVNYSASKAGIIAFTKSLAREVGSRKITVNCVAPGFINSDMTENIPKTIKDKIIENIALSSLGEPQDVANAVLFLASDDSKYITGQTIHVNGGMLMP